MIVLGIDPGLATVGYGVVHCDEKSKLKLVDYGTILTAAGEEFPLRLVQIAEGIGRLIDMFSPDCMAFEELFFNKNVKTAINVAQARGAAVAAARAKMSELYEYTPLQVKQAVVGYGRADKNQVQMMVKTLLNLNDIPKPDDAADAVAVAICHAHSAKTAGWANSKIK
ncbi:crossover junction endodeoxyribonuclease RuvC [Christensenellaceae bacterium OttesenSCG-928-K19]|nr:crossover junction endodeoxyribonuclease RuvC [Christensenellaceae bacterium OttesenSCG-928-K19]